MNYEQTLVKTIEPIKRTTITRMNRGRKWKYGYNKEHDLIVLSHNGTIGDIIEIQNLIIALPKPPKKIYKHPKERNESWKCIWRQPQSKAKKARRKKPWRKRPVCHMAKDIFNYAKLSNVMTLEAQCLTSYEN